MDEISLNTPLMRKFLEKLVVRWLRKKLSLNVLEVTLRQPVYFQNTDDGARLSVSADIFVGKEDVRKLIRESF